MKMEFQDIPIPEELDQVVEKSMKRIYFERRWERVKKSMIGCTTAAAVLAGGFFFCMSNPTFASGLPFVGHIFENMQESFGYQGDYSQIGEPLEEEAVAQKLENGADPKEMEQISKYTKTSDGLTVTLSEVYCNDQAVYVTLRMISEEPFPEITDFQCYTKETYSFNPTVQDGSVTIDGEMLDENTFAGVLRFDLNEKTTNMEEYEAAREAALSAGEEWDDSWSADGTNDNWKNYVKTVEIPDEFTMELAINKIFGGLADADTPDYGITQEEMDAMSEEEWKDFMNQWLAENPDWAEIPNEHMYKTFEGDWNFTLDVKKTTEDTQTVEINDVNEQGIGIEKVTKDRFEMTVYETYENGAVQTDYFPVILDADGELMEYGGNGSVKTVAIGNRDVSYIDVFLVDYVKWMDELKGIYWQNSDEKARENFRELFLDECAYHTTVNFG